MFSSTYHVRDAAGAWVPSTVQMPAAFFTFPAAEGCWACREYMGRDRPKRHCVARIELRPPIEGRRLLERSLRWALLIDGRFAEWLRWDRIKAERELTIAEYRARLVAMRRVVPTDCRYF